MSSALPVGATRVPFTDPIPLSKIMLPSQKFVNGKPSSFAWLFALVFIPVLLIFRTQALSATILAYAILGILYMRLKA